jgi:hypothetical protein
MLLANIIGAFDYMECSTIKGQGVREVFDEAMLQVLQPPR